MSDEDTNVSASFLDRTFGVSRGETLHLNGDREIKMRPQNEGQCCQHLGSCCPTAILAVYEPRFVLKSRVDAMHDGQLIYLQRVCNM